MQDSEKVKLLEEALRYIGSMMYVNDDGDWALNHRFDDTKVESLMKEAQCKTGFPH